MDRRSTEYAISLYVLIIAFIQIIIVVFQIGGTYAKPVLMPPQVAIGAIGKIQVGNVSFQYCYKYGVQNIHVQYTSL